MKPTRLFATIILASTAAAPIVTVVASCSSEQSGGFGTIADAFGPDGFSHISDAPWLPDSGFGHIADAFAPDAELPDGSEGDAS